LPGVAGALVVESVAWAKAAGPLATSTKNKSQAGTRLSHWGVRGPVAEGKKKESKWTVAPGELLLGHRTNKDNRQPTCCGGFPGASFSPKRTTCGLLLP